MLNRLDEGFDNDCMAKMSVHLANVIVSVFHGIMIDDFLFTQINKREN